MKQIVFPKLAAYIEERVRQFNAIPQKRKRELDRLAQYVCNRLSSDRPARLTFICTHNSRRSQMAQVWAQTAAAWFGIGNVETFSGGTKATEFNPRAVAALQRAGLSVEKTDDTTNPVYHVRFHDESPAMTAFSKVHHEQPNPGQDYCAVMTCTRADDACPVVFGAEERIALSYDDPKAFDGTEQEAQKYDERCRQISREMLYLFSRVDRKARANREA